MRLNRYSRRLPALLLAAWVVAPVACRADGDGILLQAIADELVVGFGDDTPGGQSLGARVFGGTLSPISFGQDPSFFSLSTPPAGTAALPVGVQVHWDFLPMTIDGVTSNLFHWDGQGSVGFAPPAAEALILHDASFNPISVDGSAAAVPGLRVGTINNEELSLHAHNLWQLTAQSGSPAGGVYATALRLRVDGYAPTDPLIVAMSTFGTPSSALNNEALPWFEANLGDLFLDADYNFDGVIDDGDYAVWASQFGGSTPQPVDIGEADGNGDRSIAAADYALWRDNVASAAAAVSSPAVVPEPTGFGVASAALTALVIRVRRRQRNRV